ncbi:MAG: PDZ domain-containing protein [Bryobacteraceae bacterium]|jgi:serine protease Do
MQFSKMALMVSLATGLAVLPPANAQPPRVPLPLPSGGYIGVMLHEIDTDRAKALNLSEVGGVEVTRVGPDSPADKAGLKAGDVILEYNGQRVESMEQFSRMVHETPPGREIKLAISRNGSAQMVTVKVGTRPMPGIVGMAPPERFDIHMPDIPRSVMSWRSAALGVECESLQGQLAEYFGVKEGVLVRSVLKGSAAEKAGVKAGDVITRVGDSKVATPADVSSRIRSVHGTPIPLIVIRDHKEITVTVTISEDDRGSYEPEGRARAVNSIR